MSFVLGVAYVLSMVANKKEGLSVFVGHTVVVLGPGTECYLPGTVASCTAIRNACPYALALRHALLQRL